MNAITLEVSISTIAGFSADGRVFRAFGHLLGVSAGALLLVPLGRTTGDLRQVTDGCPIPWEEAWAVLDAPAASCCQIPAEEMCTAWPKLALLSPYGWVVDAIPLAADPRPLCERMTHVSGVRFARVAP